VLAVEDASPVALAVARALAGLHPTHAERSQARDKIRWFLTRGTANLTSDYDMVSASIALTETVPERSRLRADLLDLAEADVASMPSTSPAFLFGVLRLGPSVEDRTRVKSHPALVARAPGLMPYFEPTVADVTRWQRQGIPLTPDVLAAVRRNTPLTEWLSLVRRLNPAAGRTASGR
jgi:hypothetical protein